MPMWVQSYEKQSVQEYANCFAKGIVQTNVWRTDDGDDYYERYYPGFNRRRSFANACCFVTRESVKVMAPDITQHEALRQHDYNVLREELINVGVPHEDIPCDTWLKMLNNEIVQTFLARRKEFEFDTMDMPPEYLEPDEFGRRYAIINGEACTTKFEHKKQQIWMATFPIYSYPRVLRRDHYDGEILPGYPSYKQMYYAVIGDDTLKDSTKAGIIKEVNSALRRGW
jgi:hypothetical protein